MFYVYCLDRFSPEDLGITASSLLAWMLAEVLVIWLCLYLLAVHSQLKWLDLVAFCGYKYVGMISSVGLGLLGGTYVYYCVLGYTALAIAYFLVSRRCGSGISRRVWRRAPPKEIAIIWESTCRVLWSAV